MDEMKNVSAAETSTQEKTDANYLYTNIYMMGALYSGIIAMAQNLIRWLGGPVFGMIIDRVSFKKGKYFPWLILGSTVTHISWIVLFALPLLGISGVSLRPAALVLALMIAVCDCLSTVPIHSSFPQITKDTKERQFMAMIQKTFRDGGKTIFGYICPAFLMFFMTRASESKAYAVTGLIVGIFSFAFYLAYALGLRGSYVERNAMENSHYTEGKKKMSVIQTFRVLFTNKALVMMYLFATFQKSYYFIYFFYSTYLFNYMFNDFGLLGTFVLVYNLAAIIGALCGPIVQRIFKDTKQLLITCTGIHVVFLVILALFLHQFNAVTYIAVIAGSSLFTHCLSIQDY